MQDKINLAQSSARSPTTGRPADRARRIDFDVMVVKAQGEFVWHKHDETDDFFLAIKGELDIQLRDRTMNSGRARVHRAPRRRTPAGRARGGAPASDRASRYAEHGRQNHRRASRKTA